MSVSLIESIKLSIKSKKTSRKYEMFPGDLTFNNEFRLFKLRVFDPLCCGAIETVLQICFGNFTSSLVQNGQRCTIRILRKTNCFILETRLNLKHPAELMKDAAGIFLI